MLVVHCSGISLKNPEQVREEEEAGGVEKSHKYERRRGSRGRRYDVSGRIVGDLNARVGRECCISRRAQMDQIE